MANWAWRQATALSLAGWGIGELRVRSGGVTKRYYVNGGFVQVAANIVSVLTGGAVPAERLDAEAARAELADGTNATGKLAGAVGDSRPAAIGGPGKDPRGTEATDSLADVRRARLVYGTNSGGC